MLETRPALRGGGAFQAIGKSTIMALDGREATIGETAEILRVPELCKDKFVDVVNSCVLRDKSANGPTKKRTKFFTTARNLNTVIKKKRASTTPKKSLKNRGEVAKKLHKTLRNLVEDYGSASKEQVEKNVLGIGAVLPSALTNVDGGDHDLT